MMQARRVLGALLALGLCAQPALAADPADTARAAALALVGAIDDLVEARGARDQVSALTQTIQAHEAGLSALRAGLRDAALREATIRRRFDQQSEDVSRLLAAMMVAGRMEGPALLLHPEGPLATARAGMMLADLAPAMQAEADRIGAMLREMQVLRHLRETAADTLSLGLRSLQEARTDLSQAMADRRELPPRMAESEEAMLALLASAQTLEALATGLAAAPAGLDEPLPDFTEALGRLPLPVQGAVLRRPGEADAAGVVRPGLVLATEPGALVTAPWAGTIRYRGPLMDYGNVILLEPGEGYLVVLAGLDLVYPRVGDVVSQGAPMGLMPGATPTGTEFLAAASVAGRSETLYLEIRDDGQAIDPEVWFDLTGQAQ
ncbi:murein hydrolase activator EnvC family protein [Pararhodobacter sp.]|uniref:murein hydrolase activator EnvC family protein n=1 Tax=Pararhodobacter sp. TaxID=2127056 RepID=UPI002FDD52BB